MVHTSIKELENMDPIVHGSKHVCSECAIKFYDLGKTVVACPKCGAKPLAAKMLKSRLPTAKTGRTVSGRFP
jgi:hypothetical protein